MIKQLATAFSSETLSGPIEVVIILTALSLGPMLIVATTAFTRFIIVFSLLRYSLGLQQTPPNIVLITLSFFMSVYAMSDTIDHVNEKALKPYMDEKVSLGEAAATAELALKRFMLAQIESEDFSAVLSQSGRAMPDTVENARFTDVVPAFMLSELKTAFKIGFIISLPFLLVDLVISTILMSLGMIMLPPVTISLPIKVMLFVLIDGWNLLFQALIRSIN